MVFGLLEKFNSNFVLNSSILIIGTVIIAILLALRKKDFADISKYNWDKFEVKRDTIAKHHTDNGKDKRKTRIKSYRKVIDHDKESSKFPSAQISTSSKTSEQFLSFEEGKKLQDMINYAVSIENKDDCTVEEVYEMVKETKKLNTTKHNTNLKIDSDIQAVLKR